MREKKQSKKIVIIPIVVILIVLIGTIIIVTQKDNEQKQKEGTILTRTLEVKGKEAKYALLKNEDDTFYGIQFENDDLMTRITIIRREGKKEIKDEIVDGIYKFTEDAIYKLEIETITGTTIRTDTFRVKCQTN